MAKMTPSGGNRGIISRRQLLKWMPGLAAAAALAPAPPASADVIPPTGSASAPQAETATATPSAVDMPFRTIEEGARACTWRHYWEDRRGWYVPSPIEKILKEDSLRESRLGLVNWPLLDESEDPNIGNFVFPISPLNTISDDGAQQFLLFSNTQIVANFRHLEYLEQVNRQIFDRAVWAMDQGSTGTAIVEFDRAVTDQKVDRIVQMLAYCGVTTIIWGNELNDPNAPWRDDLPDLFDIFAAAAKARKDHGLAGLELCLPGLAYFGQGEYLQKMLSTFKQLQKKYFPKDPALLPADRVADHFYGAVQDLLPRVQMMRGVMSSEGLSDFKYDLTEFGNPTLAPGQPRITDQQLAECYIPQIASLAIGSGMVDRVSFYSLLDSSDFYSVTRVSDGRLVKKPAYQSIVVLSKLLARLKSTSLNQEKDRVTLNGTRTDGIRFQVMWSTLEDRDLTVDLGNGKRVFDVLGQEVGPDKPGQLTLKPKQHPALAGPARIILG